MENCLDCKDIVSNCHTCDEFETFVSNEKSIVKLKEVRKNLMIQKPVIDKSLSGKIADWLVDKVGTMMCFYLFIVWATIPLIIPSLMTFMGYVSSGYLQLILLPLIMVAGNRADVVRQQKMEREWKINLVNARIDEMNEEESIRLQQIELQDISKDQLIQSGE